MCGRFRIFFNSKAKVFWYANGLLLDYWILAGLRADIAFLVPEWPVVVELGLGIFRLFLMAGLVL